LGVLSGRELEELKRMVNVPGLFYAGTDGLELEFQGRLVAHPLVWHSADFVVQVADALEPRVAAFPAAWVERKRFGLTVHYRQLDAELVPELLEAVEQQLEAWQDRLHVVTGAKVVEITPEIGWTKGTSVEFVMKNLGPDPMFVLYAGDEACDVEALWTAGIRGGIAIGVGPAPPTTAQYKLPDVFAVQHLLDEICQALGCLGEPTAAGSRIVARSKEAS
jgi:trehalose-phosphatase